MARTLTDGGGLDPPKVKTAPKVHKGVGAGAQVKVSHGIRSGQVAGAPVLLAVSQEQGQVRSAMEVGRRPCREHPAGVPLLTHQAHKGTCQGERASQPAQGVLGAPGAVAGVLRGRPGADGPRAKGSMRWASEKHIQNHPHCTAHDPGRVSRRGWKLLENRASPAGGGVGSRTVPQNSARGRVKARVPGPPQGRHRGHLAQVGAPVPQQG